MKIQLSINSELIATTVEPIREWKYDTPNLSKNVLHTMYLYLFNKFYCKEYDNNIPDKVIFKAKNAINTLTCTLLVQR